MKAQLKSIDLNSGVSFESFQPEDVECFGFWLTASIGASDSVGADHFQIFVCNHEWLDRQRLLIEHSVGRHVVVDEPYEACSVRRLLEARVGECTGDTWEDVAAEISRFGIWEFEGYRC